MILLDEIIQRIVLCKFFIDLCVVGIKKYDSGDIGYSIEPYNMIYAFKPLKEVKKLKSVFNKIKSFDEICVDRELIKDLILKILDSKILKDDTLSRQLRSDLVKDDDFVVYRFGKVYLSNDDIREVVLLLPRLYAYPILGYLTDWEKENFLKRDDRVLCVIDV